MWTPGPERVARANMTAFLKAVGKQSYFDAYSWSVAHPEEFWPAVWRYTGVIAEERGGAPWDSVVVGLERMAREIVLGEISLEIVLGPVTERIDLEPPFLDLAPEQFEEAALADSPVHLVRVVDDDVGEDEPCQPPCLVVFTRLDGQLAGLTHFGEELADDLAKLLLRHLLFDVLVGAVEIPAVVENVDRAVKARARVGLAILLFAAIYAVLAPRLKRDDDYEVDEAKKTIAVTEAGVAKVFTPGAPTTDITGWVAEYFADSEPAQDPAQDPAPAPPSALRVRNLTIANLAAGQGSTGPASPHPDDGKPWGSRFPVVSPGCRTATRRRCRAPSRRRSSCRSRRGDCGRAT